MSGAVQGGQLVRERRSPGRGPGNNTAKGEHDMKRTHALAVALGTVLMASAAHAGLPSHVTQIPRGEETQDPRGQEAQTPRGEETQDPRGQETQDPRGQETQDPRGQET